MIVSAGVDNVARWIRGFGAPSPAPRIVRGSDGLPIFDTDGKAVGGIRLAQFTHPLAFFLARNGGSPFCAISGHHRFYTDEELATLYPDRRDFLRGVIDTTRYNLEKGNILWPEAKQTVAEAFRAFHPHRSWKRPAS